MFFGVEEPNCLAHSTDLHPIQRIWGCGHDESAALDLNDPLKAE